MVPACAAMHPSTIAMAITLALIAPHFIIRYVVVCSNESLVEGSDDAEGRKLIL
jgi:hypothetical protein